MCGMDCTTGGAAGKHWEDAALVDGDTSDTPSATTAVDNGADQHLHAGVSKGEAAIIALLVVGLVVGAAVALYRRDQATSPPGNPATVAYNNPMYDRPPAQATRTAAASSAPPLSAQAQAQAQAESSTGAPVARCAQCNAKIQFCMCNAPSHSASSISSSSTVQLTPNVLYAGGTSNNANAGSDAAGAVYVGGSVAGATATSANIPAVYIANTIVPAGSSSNNNNSSSSNNNNNNNDAPRNNALSFTPQQDAEYAYAEAGPAEQGAMAAYAEVDTTTGGSSNVDANYMEITDTSGDINNTNL